MDKNGSTQIALSLKNMDKNGPIYNLWGTTFFGVLSKKNVGPTNLF
jgi:hypothetical protein